MAEMKARLEETVSSPSGIVFIKIDLPSNEQRHDKANKKSVRPEKTQISLGILCA